MVASNTDPLAPTPEDTALARAAAARFAEFALGDRPVRIAQVSGARAAAGEPIELPAAAVALFHRVLEEMSRGNAVTLIPIHAELTTQQAADVLGVSRPFVIKLIEEGKLPHRLVGTHRRVMFRDLMAHKQRTDAVAQRAIDELVRETQELRFDYRPPDSVSAQTDNPALQ